MFQFPELPLLFSSLLFSLCGRDLFQSRIKGCRSKRRCFSLQDGPLFFSRPFDFTAGLPAPNPQAVNSAFLPVLWHDHHSLLYFFGSLENLRYILFFIHHFRLSFLLLP